MVSKNGNLLLNIPLPGHGRPDDDEFAFLDKFGAWMALNSEAIYSTRPWKIAGEGPTQSAASTPYGPYSAICRGRYPVYDQGGRAVRHRAGWPADGKLTIKSLASGSPHYPGEIAKIGLLGSESNLVWSRNADGVTVNLPEKPPCDYAYVFKINPAGA